MVLTTKEWQRILKTIGDYIVRVRKELRTIENKVKNDFSFHILYTLQEKHSILHRKHQFQILEKELFGIREKLLIYTEFDKLIKKVQQQKTPFLKKWSEDEIRCLEILIPFKSDVEISKILKRSKLTIKEKRERIQNSLPVNLK